MAAKTLKIGKYRGLKINPGDNVVLHVSDTKKNKFHIRFEWAEWVEFVMNVKTPISDMVGPAPFTEWDKGDNNEK